MVYYTAFGKVTEGLDVCSIKLQSVEVYYRESELKDGETAPKDSDGNKIQSDTPKKQPVITSISVETYGVDYGIPKTIDPFNITSWMMKNYGMFANH